MYVRFSNRKIVSKPWQIRLWGYIKILTGNKCWEWGGAKNKLGYGIIAIENRPQLAHRMAWESTHGQIPKGICVLHKCDNPPCCNPNHLFTGKNADNVADRHKKGRSRGGALYGENHPNSKISDHQVIRIREIYSHKIREKLASQYGVSPKTIEEIANRRKRKNVLEPR